MNDTGSLGPLTLAASLGYLLGSVPFGLLLTRAAGLGDIRQIGSGNIGATNVLRTGNRKLAAATLVLDGVKGAVATVAGLLIAGGPGVFVAGLAAVLGHMAPVWLRGFKGGKGVATGIGVLIAASPPAGIAAAGVWLAVVRLSKISSAGALAAFVAAPLLMWAAAPAPLPLMALVIALLVAARHHGNIRRLIAGSEPRIGAGR